MDSDMNSDGAVSIQLSGDEALVLFEWIHRNEDTDIDLGSAGALDNAERSVLWAISAHLERHLAQPFREDYEVLLHQARSRLRPPSL